MLRWRSLPGSAGISGMEKDLIDISGDDKF